MGEKIVMTLGSLFDGSGGFPLAGALCGITPVWASEVEPYPIAVTRSRFPEMKHLGSVTEVSGAEVEPVDVITFGSPCQDLSIAGKRAGIHEGERSNLFFEAIRIIKEMRHATNGKYPAFAIWENVPGAFSSNGGEDFRCVLQELAQISGKEVSIPQPAKGKWQPAGEIVGDGFSVAWRVLDAQYWGVSQRRKRIYLVADFADGRAGKILFERESLSGDPEPGGAERKRTAGDAAGSAGGSDRLECLSFHVQQDPISNAKISPCISGQAQASIGVAAFMGGQGVKAGGIGYSEDVAPTLTGDHQNRVTDYTSVCVMAHGQSNAEIAQDMSPTLNCNHEQPIVAMEGSYKGKGHIAENISPALKAAHISEIAYGVDCRHAVLDEEKTHTLQAKANGGQSLNCTPSVLAPGKPPRKYIVRRLTPLECCRLQGFLDGWGEIAHKDEFTDAELEFWRNVRNTHATINGKQIKEHTKPQMLKWYNGLQTDSSIYKMWGNGIALPCAQYVLEGIALAMKLDDKEERLFARDVVKCGMKGWNMLANDFCSYGEKVDGGAEE